jgi:diguanylate cyclase (GGDEF)-like protein/PAS domain S-box-containing protein
MSFLSASFAPALGSLKFRVAAGVVLALTAGIGAVTAYALHEAASQAIQFERRQVQDEADADASGVSRRVASDRQALEAAAVTLDRTTQVDSNAIEHALAPQRSGLRAFRQLLVSPARGQATLCTAPAWTCRPATQFQGAAVVLAVPLQDAAGGRGTVAGAMLATPDEIFSDLQPPRGAAPADPVLVSDLQGRIIWTAVGSRSTVPGAAESSMAATVARWQREHGSDGASSPAQSGMLVASAKVGGTNCVVWRARSEVGLLSALDHAWHTAMGVAAIAILALSGLAWLFIRLQLRPLEDLEHRARHLFDGLFDRDEGWPSPAGEIGRLGQALRQVVAQRAELEAGSELAMKKLRSVMSAAPIGIAFTRSTRFELVGAEFCRLFGRSEQELLGRSPRILHATAEDDVLMAQAIGAAFDAGEPYVGEWRMRHADGHLFWVRLRGRAVDPLQPRAATIWTVYDIEEEVSRRQQLEWTANHDALTGLHNRLAFERALTRVFHSRAGAPPSALVLIDLDHFKPINDTAGHAAGDAMLRAVAKAICTHVRASDMVARLGGDEFALLLENCSPEIALKVADNVRRAVHAVRVGWGDLDLRVGASLGVASLAARTPDIAGWMAAADAACYAAKAAGRDAVRTCDAGAGDASQEMSQAPAE